MAKRKPKLAPQLKYFAATPSGDWWYVSRGKLLEADRLPDEQKYLDKRVVTGWDFDQEVVWVASGNCVVSCQAEELGFRQVGGRSAR